MGRRRGGTEQGGEKRGSGEKQRAQSDQISTTSSVVWDFFSYSFLTEKIKSRLNQD